MSKDKKVEAFVLRYELTKAQDAPKFKVIIRHPKLEFGEVQSLRKALKSFAEADGPSIITLPDEVDVIVLTGDCTVTLEEKEDEGQKEDSRGIEADSRYLGGKS